MGKPELYVAFACDTEDNHPNYIPGWDHYGSNYELNPAILKWTWTKYWPDLSDQFAKRGAPVTWLIRVDSGPAHDTMLNLYKNKIFELKSLGDEIGIHIHTWSWNDKLSKWVQTIDPSDEVQIVLNSLEMFQRHLGFAPLSARMGWTAMSNEIMRTLDSKGIIAEASAVSGLASLGKFGCRDNIFDWSRTPSTPYHPDAEDYQSPGDMGILELPVSSLKSKKQSFFEKMVNELSGKKSLLKLVNVAKAMRLTPHYSFYITPWWSSSIYRKIIREYGQKAREEGTSFLIGTFHPCDILNPKTGAMNRDFEKCVSGVLDDILSIEQTNVNFISLADMAKKIETGILSH